MYILRGIMQGEFTTGRFKLCDYDRYRIPTNDLPPTQHSTDTVRFNTILNKQSHVSERSSNKKPGEELNDSSEFNYSLDMADRITYVPVEWILKNLTGSVDVEEPGHLIVDIVEMKVRDCATILCNIEKYGFIYPIVIQTDRMGSHFTMGNGHHRLTAAIFLYLDTIPVYFSTSEDYMCYKYSTGAELNSSLEDIPYIEELLEEIYTELPE